MKILSVEDSHRICMENQRVLTNAGLWGGLRRGWRVRSDAGRGAQAGPDLARHALAQAERSGSAGNP